MREECGIYLIYNKVNGKRYIGGSKNLHRRKTMHLSDLRLGKHGNSNLQEEFNSFGGDSFVFVALRYIQDCKHIFAIEADWINWCNPEYNIVLPEDRNIPKSARTEASKKKLSKTIKRLHREGRYKNRRPVQWKAGKPNRLGVKLSEETKDKIRQANLREKNPNWGVPRSPETKRKQSENRTKRYPPMVSPEGVVYENINNMRNFCESRGMKRTAGAMMCSVANGRVKSYRGWTRYNGGKTNEE